MDNKSGLFVEHENGFVFVKNVERNCLRFDINGLRARDGQGNVVAWLDLMAGFDDSAIDQNVPLFD